MAPEPRPVERSGTSVGTVITGHRISLNIHYDNNNGVTDKMGGSVTPVEEKVAYTGALQAQKNLFVTASVVKDTTAKEEHERESLHSSLESNLTQLRPETPETNSAHSEEDIRTSPLKEKLQVTTQASAILKREYLNGPDQVIPSDKIKTWEPTGAIKIRLGSKGPSSLPPISVPTFFKNVVEKYPNSLALSVKREGQWQNYTYSEYYQSVRTVAKAFIRLGLDMYHGVCILGFNSPEWFMSSLGTVFAGGFSAGVYTTNTPEACQHCANNCKAQIWVVEDQKQLDKVLKIRPNLPNLKTIVQYIGKPTVDGVLSWNQMMEIGKSVPDDVLEERMRRIAVNQCCSLIYTSGTTGQPKGVMLSHDNLTFTSTANAENIGMYPAKEVIVSYLPLSHIAAQLADIYFPMYAAGKVAFAMPDALKGSLPNTLREIRPTRFLGVPRVWEKIYDRMMDVGRKTTGLKKTISTWAKSLGSEVSHRRQQGNFTKPAGFGVANAVVFKKVKAALGFDRCHSFWTGAAPIAPEILDYFHSLDICVIELYGMSESSGPHTVSKETSFRIGSVGETVPGCYSQILNPDAGGNGEICMGGRHVSMGYLRMEDKTEEAIDDQGWLHSGDIGRFDQDGHLYITGRIKEIIITAGGENIPPVLIEDAVKGELVIISNAMLIGDKRKFLSMLLTVKTNMDEDGEPLDTLVPSAVEWCRSIGSRATTIQDVLSPDEAIMKAIQAGVDRANKQASSNAQKVQKWTILPRDFTVPGDELGPTLKLKRPVVVKKYTETIEKFYA